MGTIQHHAVVATTYSDKDFERCLAWIQALEPVLDFDPRKLFVSGDGVMNGYRTIVMVPDGSKERWPHSDECEAIRQRFIDHLEQPGCETSFSRWDWMEVSFGEYGYFVTRPANCD